LQSFPPPHREFFHFLKLVPLRCALFKMNSPPAPGFPSVGPNIFPVHTWCTPLFPAAPPTFGPSQTPCNPYFAQGVWSEIFFFTRSSFVKSVRFGLPMDRGLLGLLFSPPTSAFEFVSFPGVANSRKTLFFLPNHLPPQLSLPPSPLPTQFFAS